MDTIVGLKELRRDVAKYAAEVRKGKSFLVVRHSKPLFKITPPSADEDGGLWETVVDFTKIKKGGMPIMKLLSRL